MNRPSIATLTWATIVAAVLSAGLLAAGEPALPDQAGDHARCASLAKASPARPGNGRSAAASCPAA